MPNLSDLELLQKLNADQGFFNFTPEDMKRFKSMPESKQIKEQMKAGRQAREEGFKSARDARDSRANKNLHKDQWKAALSGYASRVEGKDASGEYLTAAQRKDNFKKQKAVSFINGKSDGNKGAGVGKNGALALRAPSQISP